MSKNALGEARELQRRLTGGLGPMCAELSPVMRQEGRHAGRAGGLEEAAILGLVAWWGGV